MAKKWRKVAKRVGQEERREKKRGGRRQEEGKGSRKEEDEGDVGEKEELWERNREMPGRSVKRKRFSNL